MQEFGVAGGGAGEQTLLVLSHQPLVGVGSHASGHVLLAPGVQPGLEASVQASVNPLVGLKDRSTWQLSCRSSCLQTAHKLTQKNKSDCVEGKKCFQCSPGEPVSAPYVCTCSLLTCRHKPSCRCWAWTCTRSSARRCRPATCQRNPWFSAAAAAPIFSGTSLSVSGSWRAEANGQRSTTPTEQISWLLHTSKDASTLQEEFTPILQKGIAFIFITWQLQSSKVHVVKANLKSTESNLRGLSL